MKKYILLSLILIFTGSFLLAQPDLESFQRKWVENVKTGEPATDFYWENRYLAFVDITSNESNNIITLVRSGEIPAIKTYEHEQIFRHDGHRYISVGKLVTDGHDVVLLTGWRNVEEGWKKEIDVILSKSSPDEEVGSDVLAALNNERQKWVKLANEHNPEAHIKASYTGDAVYFGNGEKSEGRAEIAERYFYMENPDYQVALEMEELWNIAEDKVLEAGRYFVGTERRGEGGLYVILWEKQETENWQIKLDFNF